MKKFETLTPLHGYLQDLIESIQLLLNEKVKQGNFIGGDVEYTGDKTVKGQYGQQFIFTVTVDSPSPLPIKLI